MAEALFRMDSYTGAAKYYMKVLEEQPTLPPSKRKLDLIRSKTGQADFVTHGTAEQGSANRSFPA